MPSEAAQHLSEQHKAQGRGIQSPETQLQRGEIRGCLTQTARSSIGTLGQAPHKLSSSQPNLRGVLTLGGGKPATESTASLSFLQFILLSCDLRPYGPSLHMPTLLLLRNSSFPSRTPSARGSRDQP